MVGREGRREGYSDRPEHSCQLSLQLAAATFLLLTRRLALKASSGLWESGHRCGAQLALCYLSPRNGPVGAGHQVRKLRVMEKKASGDIHGSAEEAA